MGYWPATRTLYVVNHAVDGPTIEVFTLDNSGTKAKFQRTLSHALIRTPNSVQPVSDHEIYFTNDHTFEMRQGKWLARAETYLSYAGGSVVRMDVRSGVAKVVARLPFANGVAALNQTHLAVASSSTPSVNVYEMDGQTGDLALKKSLRMRWVPDNLFVDGKGRLLIAGHPYAPDVERAAITNSQFDLDGTGVGRPASERPRAASWLAEWDGNEEGVLRDLYVGFDYGTGCVLRLGM